jgi:DNA topoisomerase IB
MRLRRSTPNGHIQAVGTDDAGRRQYLYHERWRSDRDEEKHERVLTPAPLLPDSAKDLRTWHAMVQAAVAFAVAERPESQRGRRTVATGVMREVAEELGNTPAIARKSYVDPRVATACEDGRTIRAAVEKAGQADPVSDRARAVLEPAVVRLLRRA